METTKITSPMLDDLIDNITPEGTDRALINCDKCQYNKSCDRGVRMITNCNSYTNHDK